MADCLSIDNTVQLYAHECRGGFDFPLLFEETILVLLPVALATLIAVFRLTSLLKNPVTTASKLLVGLKAVRPPTGIPTIEVNTD